MRFEGSAHVQSLKTELAQKRAPVRRGCGCMEGYCDPSSWQWWRDRCKGGLLPRAFAAARTEEEQEALQSIC
jgi:hypothetical protein